MSKGYMLISRERIEELMQSSTPVMFYIFIRLLFKANYEPKQVDGMIVGRGQLIFSYDKLCVELGVSLQTLRTNLRNMQTNMKITLEPTRRFTLLTICEYDSWQMAESEGNTQANIKLTPELTSTKLNINNKLNNNNLSTLTSTMSETSDANKDCAEEIAEYFNKKIKERGSVMPAIRSLGGQRLSMLKARIRESGADAVREAIDKAVSSSFLNGGGNRGFIADFTWLVRPNNFPKVLEGNYDDHTPQQATLFPNKKETYWQT